MTDLTLRAETLTMTPFFESSEEIGSPILEVAFYARLIVDAFGCGEIDFVEAGERMRALTEAIMQHASKGATV